MFQWKKVAEGTVWFQEALMGVEETLLTIIQVALGFPYSDVQPCLYHLPPLLLPLLLFESLL